ncbi:helix-turn-helix transcriptional regulator [Clostridium sp. BSD9I1]|uniref:helix-turn-helix transcriptional regulator n=1 Tax=Clostridium sp. BSD9I1 TaxID=2003589 RepID=UPI001FA90219|nr:helix-turn-helix transcriptional regulator [Clostridium sp. BSD9I1]
MYSIATYTQEFSFKLISSLYLVYPFLNTDTIGIRLWKIRKQKGLSPDCIAEKIGLHYQGVISLENGASYPSPKVLLKLYELFGNDIICDDYSSFIVSDPAKQFKEWRATKKISIDEAAQILATSSSSLYSWENKISYISKKSFNKIKNKIIF